MYHSLSVHHDLLQFAPRILIEQLETFSSGIPRKLNEDDQFRGFHIPKGTLIISNLW